MHLTIAATNVLKTNIVQAIIGFTLIALLFWLIESIWPEDRQQPRWRRGSLTDTLYYFLLIPASRFVGTIGLFVALVLVVRYIPSIGFAFVGQLPLALQAFAAIFIGDLIGYWNHRAFHTFPLMWGFHAVHHSSEQLDWLASVRVHPLETIWSRLVTTVPLFLIGFSKLTLGGYVIFLALYPLLLHANVSWSFGPLRYVIASPAFHRWHHTAERAGLDKNLAGLFPIFDVVFGTLYFPRRASSVYGLYGEHLSSNIFTQLWYPFRRKSSRSQGQIP